MDKSQVFISKGRDSSAPTSLVVLMRYWLVPGLLALSLLAAGLHQAHALVGRQAPNVTSTTWMNSEPLDMKALRGRVVLVEFWTFGCYNCRNIEPKIKEWHDRYAKSGLVVIGIHSPEFAYEKDVAAVRDYLTENGISYAVAVDNDFVNWRRYGNRYWPCIYLIDKQGTIRYVRAGEGGYAKTEGVIQALINE